MNNKLLIETLLKHQPISAYNISKIINTSKKTVYNSIDEINSGEVIIFSQDGKFFGDKEKLNEYLESNKNLFVNRRERILLKLLLNEDGIDYFDLANYFYVSDSTILNDVTKINKTYEVKIKRSKDMLYLDIDKDKKSELLQTILRSENNNKIVTLKNLYDYVDPKSYLDTLISIVTKCLSKQNLKLDNKLYIDFIVNLLIIVRDSYNIEAYINKEDIEYKSPYEFIKNNIEYEFQIKLSEHNKKYLQNEVNMVFYEKFDYKNQDYKMLLERIFSTIKEKFDIELTYTENELFLNHLLMMVNRVQNGVVIESPITKIIKTENVLFFELALVIASEIEKYFNLKRKINENEVP